MTQKTQGNKEQNDMYADARNKPHLIPKADNVPLLDKYFVHIMGFVLLIIFGILLIIYDKNISDGLKSVFFSLFGAAVGFIFSKETNR